MGDASGEVKTRHSLKQCRGRVVLGMIGMRWREGSLVVLPLPAFDRPVVIVNPSVPSGGNTRRTSGCRHCRLETADDGGPPIGLAAGQTRGQQRRRQCASTSWLGQAQYWYEGYDGRCRPTISPTFLVVAESTLLVPTPHAQPTGKIRITDRVQSDGPSNNAMPVPSLGSSRWGRYDVKRSVLKSASFCYHPNSLTAIGGHDRQLFNKLL
jgi:hypothetical protein